MKSLTWSKYRGVKKLPSGNWQVKINVNGVRTCVGTFTNEKEAAESYDKQTRELGRKKLNFPTQDEKKAMQGKKNCLNEMFVISYF